MSARAHSTASDSGPNDIAIVGGGLAGMAAALRLAERGCRVTLYEASDRLGGKAGATRHGADFDEHGYHIFPMWYANIWRLVDELGIRDHFVDRADFLQLEPDQFPAFKTLRNLTSLRHAWPNLRSGIMPLPEMFLFFYAALDLMGKTYNYRALLDQISMTGFIRSHFYRTEHLATLFQDLMLKGISVPSHFVSAMTMRIVMRYWARSPVPMYRILRGNLQEQFIFPIQQRLEAAGGEIQLGQRLERLIVADGRVTHLCFRDVATSETHQREIDRVVLAVPVDSLIALIDDEVYAAAPALRRVANLRSRPMAALNLYLNERLADMPRDHINLIGSKFGLSFLDVSQTWSGYDVTVINAIASDCSSLEGSTPDVAAREMVAELGRYIPGLSMSKCRRIDFQSHVDEPLFMNDVGSWPFRLDALPRNAADRIELTNLYPAGDHCRSHIDLVSMEGAFTTGLRAAEAIRRDTGIAQPVAILEPPVHPQWLLLSAKWLLLPFAVAAKAWLVLQTHRSAQSDSANGV